MGFQDELRGLSSRNERPRQRYSLDSARIEEAAKGLLAEMKTSLRTAAANGRASRAGILGTKRSVYADYQFHPNKALVGTPHQATSTFEGEVSVYWRFHDVHEARLVARRMSQLGQADGIRVSVESHPNGFYYFRAVATY